MLEARGIAVCLGGRRVVEAVGLAVAPGEIVALMGPNGAGKSSVLACLSGALRPEAGCVRMDGRDPAAMTAAALARARAVLDQTPVLGAPFTVRDLVALPVPREVPVAEARGLVLRALSAVGLAGLADRPVHTLSGGERQRAHMGRAMAQLLGGQALGGGRWLLLDEPTAGLDLAHQDAVGLAAREAARSGAGVLAVLHDLTFAAALADRIVLMHRGRVRADGPPESALAADRLAEIYGLPVTVTQSRPLAVTPLYTCQR